MPNSMDTESERGSENGKGSSKHLRVQFDATQKETYGPLQPSNASCYSSPSMSSSSSESSSDSTITDPDGGDSLTKSNPSSLEHDGDLLSESKTSQVPLSSAQTDSAPQFPPLYMGGRAPTTGYDPNRIPTSVFNSKPTNPADWSVTSNESLFSIHMGNNSFPRDHAFLLYKSGELMKLDEVFSVPTILPPVAEVACPRLETVDSSDETAQSIDCFSGIDKANSAKAATHIVQALSDPSETMDAGKATGEDNKGKMSPLEDARTSTSLSTRSDGSTASIASFAFPILSGPEGKASPTKAETRREDSPEPMLPPPPPRAQPSQTAEQNSTTSSGGTSTSWFSCFSCCSFRCALSLK